MWHLSFDPLLSWPFLALFAVVVVLLATLLFWKQVRGGILRSFAMALGLLALANPVLNHEERDPLTSVAAVIVDKSDSQKMDGRSDATEAALASLTARLGSISNLETRIIETEGREPNTEGTALFSSLARELADVPPDRIAGAIFLTDGQVSDVPKDTQSLGFNAPIHTLLTGREDEFDQRLVVIEAPRFGIVGEEKQIRFRIERTDNNQARANVTIRLNGQTSASENVPVGQEINLAVAIDRGGKNVLEIRVEEAVGELTTANNTSVQIIEGIRENLRVLLVSGEPHAGERTWRNLLKSDASVDLVHFTILRPPEKQDGTPINQLSLIAFPTRELFSVKINEFDLIIFDRYQRRGVLPILYFDNIAQYVQNGGAVLVAAGPEYADALSIYQTPLAPVLPAVPVGDILQEPYHAKVTDQGFRHPVTRDLKGATSDPPDWSRWFRLINVASPKGDVVMSGPDEKPLLVLNRENEGRVALMLSDHAWLWARGFEGGGPHVELLRRLSHWLMKEPDLEEEALRGFVENGDLVVERQTMAETANATETGSARIVTLTTPSGQEQEMTLEPVENGILQARIAEASPGLYEATDGELNTLLHVGPPNPKEFQEVVSTEAWMTPLAEQTGGRILRMEATTPGVIAMNNSSSRARTYGGRDWFGLKMTDASILQSIERIPLFAGLLGLAFLLTAFVSMWYREGR